ncbi:MAG: SDR family oxidoreductase [Actinomycetota bacterium]|nr:SDR family oxidoreductase [Actinomycetota bacterium]
MGKLEGKVAVVTGAASGIGAGISVAFAKEGATVVLLDLVEESGFSSTVSQIVALGSDHYFTYRCDVADEQQVNEMAIWVSANVGDVDIVVNNAGIFIESSVVDMTTDIWDKVLGVNLRGTFLVTRAFLRSMIERKSGKIVNIASQLAQIGGTEASAYAASKGGVIAFTKSLAREVATLGISVNAIAPGPIKTPLLDGETPEWRERKLAELPIGRFGEVSEVVPTAILLASEDGSYYVGAVLGPNGGDVMN